METQPDYEEMCAALNDAGVEFPVVGAHALAAHGHVRATKDLDIWVRPSLDNAARVMQALHAFGAPTQRVSVDDFAVPEDLIVNKRASGRPQDLADVAALEQMKSLSD